ncbi:hypothetical protein GCM10010176_020310 [Nonomuraea spiralis]|nr:hypothetical protein GCM10010176_020310 [Nonomuraea spiralis]
MLSALADVEDTLGHRDIALNLERDALRLRYRSNDPNEIAISHQNLGLILFEQGNDLAHAAAHITAASVIWTLTGGGHLDNSLQALTFYLADAPDLSNTLGGLDSLCRIIDQIDGFHFGKLVAILAPEPAAAQRAMGIVVATVRARISSGLHT